MGLAHLRLGPNKVALFGLIQPLLDALKLLSKKHIVSSSSNKATYYVSPFLSLGLSLVLWIFLPSFYFISSNAYSLYAIIVVCSIIVFGVLLSGWSSNSKYSFIGSLRSVAQSISYEVVFTTLFIIVTFLSFSYSVTSISHWFFIGMYYLLPIWLFTVIAESHRAPFDFSESESELVSGFNTEYTGALFAYIFLSEYSSLLVSCILITWIFFPFICFSVLSFCVTVLLVSVVIVFIRVTYCRYRYDLLMTTAWKSFLPVSIFLLLLFLMFL